MYAQPREGLGFVEARSGPQGHCYGCSGEVTRSFGSTGHCLIKLAMLPIPPPAALLRPIPRGTALPTACAPDVTTEAQGMYEIPADRSSGSQDPFSLLKRTAEPRACGVIFGLC